MTKRGYHVDSDLQDDRKLDGPKLAAGPLSVGLLVAMFVMSLYRAPDV
ncbi:MAG: hypothetical protein M3460_17780 [Actinomycetota bacterium]|nr:hypothetical protein [Actinomycetota bacterium]